MSSDTFKFLHSRRMLNTENAIKKQTTIAKAYGVVEKNHTDMQSTTQQIVEKRTVYFALTLEDYLVKKLYKKSLLNNVDCKMNILITMSTNGTSNIP